MAIKRSKIDNRQFADIPKRNNIGNWGDGKLYKKKKYCLNPNCKEMFHYISAKELYCCYCKTKH